MLLNRHTDRTATVTLAAHARRGLTIASLKQLKSSDGTNLAALQSFLDEVSEAYIYPI